MTIENYAQVQCSVSLVVSAASLMSRHLADEALLLAALLAEPGKIYETHWLLFRPTCAAGRRRRCDCFTGT